MSTKKTTNWVSDPHFGVLGVTHDVGRWLFRKPMVDFLFFNWTFFAIYYGSGVMRRNMYSSSVFTGGSTSLYSNFTWTESCPINCIWQQKTRDTAALRDFEDRISLRSLVLTQQSVTDRQTDLPQHIEPLAKHIALQVALKIRFMRGFKSVHSMYCHW